MQSEIYYLQTEFQNSIELAHYYSNLPAPEEHPYDNKYIAINILKSLKQTPYSFIPEALLGEIYSDVDQNSDSMKAYLRSLQLFANLENFPEIGIHNYYNTLINVYNILGLTYLNRDQNEQGVSLLAKSTILYEAYKDIKHENVYHNRNKPQNILTFKYYFQGGINSQKMEQSYTLTLFYLAQAYTKLGFKDKAAQYCGRTLQRQFLNKTFELKEFCMNLISLAEYYQNNRLFGQAQYLLLTGLELLPQGKKKKLHATLFISLGNLMNQLLNFCCVMIRNNQQNQPNADQILSRKIFQFEGLNIKFPKINLARDLQQCKSLFRQANTQYKKAIQTFVLDGYVTQHIQILFSQSKLYKTLCLVQDSKERRASMMQKRKQLLEPILNQLNPKAYQNTWQRILVQLAQISNQLFDQKFRIIFDTKDKIPNQNKLKQMNDCGYKAIEYYTTIQQTLLESKDVQKNQAYYQSIINSKFNVAKTYSKLYHVDNKMRVQELKKSLKKYTELKNYITNLKSTTQFKTQFNKEEQLSKQMIEMLPSKIDRVNYGLMNGIME